MQDLRAYRGTQDRDARGNQIVAQRPEQLVHAAAGQCTGDQPLDEAGRLHHGPVAVGISVAASVCRSVMTSTRMLSSA